MESVSESESLSIVFDSLLKLTLDFSFTRLRSDTSATQHVVAIVDGPAFGCVFKTGCLSHSFPVSNGSLEITSAITCFCPHHIQFGKCILKIARFIAHSE